VTAALIYHYSCLLGWVCRHCSCCVHDSILAGSTRCRTWFVASVSSPYHLQSTYSSARYSGVVLMWALIIGARDPSDVSNQTNWLCLTSTHRATKLPRSKFIPRPITQWDQVIIRTISNACAYVVFLQTWTYDHHKIQMKVSVLLGLRHSKVMETLCSRVDSPSVRL